MSKAFGAITGAGAIEQGTKDAAAAAAFQGGSASGVFGDASIDNQGNLTTGQGIGTALAPQFQGFAQQQLGQAGAAPSGVFNALDPNQAFQQAQGTGGGIAGQFLGAAGGFLQGANQIGQSLQNFDQDAFISQQLERLNTLARPGEETRANAALQGVFSGGRLGQRDSLTGKVARGLQEAEQTGQTQRALQAIGLGQSELQSRIGAGAGLAGIAGQLGISGEQIGGGQLGRFLQSLGGAQSLGGFQNQLQGSLLQQSLGATQGISSALAPAQQNVSNLLATTGLNNQQNALQAQIIQQGSQAAGAATGSFTGGLISGAASAFAPGSSTVFNLGGS